MAERQVCARTRFARTRSGRRGGLDKFLRVTRAAGVGAALLDVDPIPVAVQARGMAGACEVAVDGLPVAVRAGDLVFRHVERMAEFQLSQMPASLSASRKASRRPAMPSPNRNPCLAFILFKTSPRSMRGPDTHIGGGVIILHLALQAQAQARIDIPLPTGKIFKRKRILVVRGGPCSAGTGFPHNRRSRVRIRRCSNNPRNSCRR